MSLEGGSLCHLWQPSTACKGNSGVKVQVEAAGTAAGPPRADCVVLLAAPEDRAQLAVLAVWPMHLRPAARPLPGQAVHSPGVQHQLLGSRVQGTVEVG